MLMFLLIGALIGAVVGLFKLYGRYRRQNNHLRRLREKSLQDTLTLEAFRKLAREINEHSGDNF